MRECNEYLTNRIYYNFVTNNLSDIDYHLATYCIYALYTMITQQPCFEDNSRPSYIYLPEYAWSSVRDLVTFSETKEISDLQMILKHMIRSQYFVYCLERPVPYTTSKTDPFDTDGKIYCHGTRSRVILTPTDLVSVMEIPLLSSHKNRYQEALRKCGSNFTDDNSTNFVSRLREIRSNYQQKLTKMQKYREHGHVCESMLYMFVSLLYFRVYFHFQAVSAVRISSI